MSAKLQRDGFMARLLCKRLSFNRPQRQAVAVSHEGPVAREDVGGEFGYASLSQLRAAINRERRVKSLLVKPQPRSPCCGDERRSSCCSTAPAVVGAGAPPRRLGLAYPPRRGAGAELHRTCAKRQQSLDAHIVNERRKERRAQANQPQRGGGRQWIRQAHHW